MTTISNAELALLSLIMEQPRHAYEIEQVIEARVMRNWTEIGFSSIYRLLSKLEKSGWLSGQTQPPEGRGPARKVYHITPAGKAIWQEAMLQNLAQPERKYSSFLLGLDGLDSLPAEEVMQALTTNLSAQQSTYQQFREAVDAHPQKDDFFIGIFFDYLLNQLESEIAWLQRLHKRLEAHYHGK